MKHFKPIVCEPTLSAEDIAAIARDEASEIRAGRLSNGICENCGEDYRLAVGVHRCVWCAEGY